jgi:hypothetical protein
MAGRDCRSLFLLGPAAGRVVKRPGIAIRIDITDDELRALRIYAIEHKSTVPKLLAEEIRKLLKSRKP